MNPARLSTTLAIVAAVMVLGTCVVVWVWRWRRKSPAEIERLRRLDVNRRGRITTGRIVDLIEPEPSKPGARLIMYKYELGGVTYEAGQDVSTLPGVIALARRATDLIASVKYDPKVPTNSIIVCEDWSGIPGDDRPSQRQAQAARKAESRA